MESKRITGNRKLLIKKNEKKQRNKRNKPQMAALQIYKQGKSRILGNVALHNAQPLAPF